MIVVSPKKSIVKIILGYFGMGFLFVALLGATFLGVQWFSNSVEGFFSGHNVSYNNTIFLGDLQASASGQPSLEINLPQPSYLPVTPATNTLLKKNSTTVDASSALSVQISNGLPIVLFSKNADEKLPVASLTKLMTALLVLERYDLNQMVTISTDAMAQEGEQGVLKLGEKMTVKDLLYITLIESSNRSAYALSEVMGADSFVIAMNQRASGLGMANTHFVDSSGLDPASYSTATDLAILTQYIFENYPMFRQIVGLKNYDLYTNGILHHKLQTTNLLLSASNIIGGKTGYTNEAKGCVIELQQNPDGHFVISVILGANDRFFEMQKLINIVSK